TRGSAEAAADKTSNIGEKIKSGIHGVAEHVHDAAAAVVDRARAAVSSSHDTAQDVHDKAAGAVWDIAEKSAAKASLAADDLRTATRDAYSRGEEAMDEACRRMASVSKTEL
ncbi:hypothetical protein VaNZ11_003834, partial [Volvox africanus]